MLNVVLFELFPELFFKPRTSQDVIAKRNNAGKIKALITLYGISYEQNVASSSNTSPEEATIKLKLTHKIIECLKWSVTSLRSKQFSISV